MAGPTAAESLIKAAAAGEGEWEGGGARRKGWKEVGGSTRLRPPNPSPYVQRTLETSQPRVQDQESPVDMGQGSVGVGFVKPPACWRKELGAPVKRAW